MELLSSLHLDDPSLSRPLCAVLGGGALLYGLFKLHRANRLRKLRAKWAAAGTGVVVLHALPRPRNHPSLTPFGTKLETFLRMMGIKYVMDFAEPIGPKRKSPWITLDGEDFSDSQLIAEMLMERFQKNPDADLRPEQRAVSLAMRLMFEEHLYWGAVSWRYFEDDLKGLFSVMDLPFLAKLWLRSFKSQARAWMDGQGMGRHSVAEIRKLTVRDLQAFSDYLGEKPFLLGGEPHVDDCAIFGFLTGALYGAPGSHYQTFIKDTPNLIAYVERMKARYWSDWEQVIGKQEA